MREMRQVGAQFSNLEGESSRGELSQIAIVTPQGVMNGNIIYTNIRLFWKGQNKGVSLPWIAMEKVLLKDSHYG